jgi:hypothetical protein
MTKRRAKVTEEREVRNKLIFVWADDDGDVQTYEKLLHRPKGKTAREALPKVLKFMKNIASIQEQLDKAKQDDVVAQMGLVEQFFTEENEGLFPIILQLENQADQDAFDELNPVAVLDLVVKASEYIISESFNRPDVQVALKKSAGEGDTASR